MIWALLSAAVVDSATVCVRDARNEVPLAGVHAVSGEGHTVHLVRACTSLAVGSWTLRRIGYRAQRVTLGGESATITVFMQAIADAPLLLETKVVRATRPADNTNAPDVARTTATLGVDSARMLGVTSMPALLSALPFASARGARGEVGLSLRGSRREAVVVTLDGMPLNDPATGMADVSDVPLALVGSAAVSLGSDPLGAGPGAGGGVLTLQSVARRSMAIEGGSFGARSLEGAYHAVVGNSVLASSASYRSATNNFSFVNDAGAGDATSDLRERRVNNDEQRGALTFAASADRVHALLMLSAGERGMVGPANVRTYDADRSRVVRALLRAESSVRRVSLSVGARLLSMEYRDPTRPELDSDANTVAADVDARGVLGTISWRMGGGADRVTATGGLRQSRGRSFISASRTAAIGGTRLGAGARLDAVGTFGALPSLSGDVRHDFVRREDGAFFLSARVAQAVRVPTLYDLYFSSPQRLFVRTLRAERVSFDGEIGGGGTARTPLGTLQAHAAFVARNVRDAIVWFPGNFGFSPQNAGIERLRGVEARTMLNPGWGSVSAWVTRYDTELAIDALRIPTPYVAAVSGGVQAAAALAGFTMSASVRANSARPYTAGPRDPDFELPAVTLLDAALSRGFPVMSARALVALSLQNATDVSWQQVRGFPAPGRSWALSLNLSPATPQ